MDAKKYGFFQVLALASQSNMTDNSPYVLVGGRYRRIPGSLYKPAPNAPPLNKARYTEQGKEDTTVPLSTADYVHAAYEGVKGYWYKGAAGALASAGFSLLDSSIDRAAGRRYRTYRASRTYRRYRNMYRSGRQAYRRRRRPFARRRRRKFFGSRAYRREMKWKPKSNSLFAQHLGFY